MSSSYCVLVPNNNTDRPHLQTLKLDDDTGILRVTESFNFLLPEAKEGMGIAKATFGDITYIICAGGINGEGILTESIHVFKIEDGVVTNIPTGLSLGMTRSGVGGIAFPAVPVPGEEALQVVLFVGGLEETGPVDIVELFTINAAGVLDTGTGFLNLSVARSNVTMATIEVDGSPIVICAGGVTEDGPSAVIDTLGVGYSAAAELSVARSNIGIATVEIEGTHYVVCVGGEGNEETVNTIDVFSVGSTGVLTPVAEQPFLTEAMHSIGMATATIDGHTFVFAIGGYKNIAPANIALFGGGTLNQNKADSRVVDAFDIEGDDVSKHFSPSLGVARYGLAAASVGNIVLFAGGNADSGLSKVVEGYRIEGTTVTRFVNIEPLSRARDGLVAASVGNVIFFAGGSASGDLIVNVDAYVITGDVVTKPTIQAFAAGRSAFAAASAGNVVLFAGGHDDFGLYSDWVVGYKVGERIERIEAASLGTPRLDLAGASVGNFILFAGGTVESGYATNEVDGYVVIDMVPHEYEGYLTKLDVPRSKLAGASAGNVILFAGGYTGSHYSDVVEGYVIVNDVPVKIVDEILPLSVARRNLVAVSVGNIILFAGGDTGDYFSKSVMSYTGSTEGGNTLQEQFFPPLESGREYLAAASVGNVILFGGGRDISNSSKAVEGYRIVNGIVTKLANVPDLTAEAQYLAAAGTGNVILFGGGSAGNAVSVVTAYFVSDDSVTKLSSPSGLTIGRQKLAAARAGNFILFGGGSVPGMGQSVTYSNAVDVYYVDGSNVSKFPDMELSSSRENLAAAGVGNVVLFAGGYSISAYHSTVDGFGISGNTIIGLGNIDSLEEARLYLAAVGVGSVILFAGGSTERGLSAKVEVYKVNGTTVTKMANASDLSVARCKLSAACFHSKDGYDYVVFSGGISDVSDYSDAVDVYKVSGSSVSKVTNRPIPPLFSGFSEGAGAGVGNVAVFGGGRCSSYSDVVDAYKVENDNTVTKLDSLSMPMLQQAKTFLAGAGVSGEFRSFADRVEIFEVHADGHLVHMTKEPNLLSKKGHVGTSVVNVGDKPYLVCAGGTTTSGASKEIEVFKLSIPVTKK